MCNTRKVHLVYIDVVIYSLNIYYVAVGPYYVMFIYSKCTYVNFLFFGFYYFFQIHSSKLENDRFAYEIEPSFQLNYQKKVDRSKKVDKPIRSTISRHFLPLFFYTTYVSVSRYMSIFFMNYEHSTAHICPNVFHMMDYS